MGSVLNKLMNEVSTAFSIMVLNDDLNKSSFVGKLGTEASWSGLRS